MAKIDPVAPNQAGWLLKAANRYSKRRVGRELEPSAVLAHHTAILGAYGLFELASGRAKSVPDRIKSLAELKAAMMVGCPF
jgi:hypothetical protein